MAAEGAGLRVAFFGAMSPLAREVRQQLAGAAFPLRTLRLYESEERAGAVTEYDGEAQLVTRPDADEAGETDLAFVCGEDDPMSASYLDWIPDGRGITLDLVGASRQRAGVPVVNLDVNPEAIEPSRRLVATPHPLAVPLSTIVDRLRRSLPLKEVSATVLRPAADYGDEGIDELHHQTVALLSFGSLPTEVLGRRLAFNLVPVAVKGGAEAALEEFVRGDVGRVLGPAAPRLSVRIIEVPVFHGHGLSIRACFDGDPGAAAVAAALASEGTVQVSRAEECRTPADLGEQGGIWIGDVSADRGAAGACWIWAVTDALRSGAALNAARVAGRAAEMLA